MKMFHRSFGGPTQVCFDTTIRRIMYSTRVYSPAVGSYVSVTIDICKDDWVQLIKYGKDVGFNDD